MAFNGFIYRYQLQTAEPQEYEAANFAYTQAGWLEIDVILKDGQPFQIVFKWPYDQPPRYPFVNWP